MKRWSTANCNFIVWLAAWSALTIPPAEMEHQTWAEDAPPNLPPQTASNDPAAEPPTEPVPVPPPPAVRSESPTLENAPAADGTVSVVVDPPAVPPVTPRINAGPPQAPDARPNAPVDGAVAAAAASVATLLLSRSLEPLETRQASVQLTPSSQSALPTNTSLKNPLYARPLPLLEALVRSGDRARRLWITQAYWKVSAGFILVRWATESIDRLELIAPGGDPHDRASLDVAVAGAKADLADARAELIAAQQELVDLIRLPISEPLPWPVDCPLAGPYQTHFDAIFAARPATGRIRAIDRMLPSKYEALESRAVAVVDADKAMQMTESDHAKGQRPIESVIAAHGALVLQQREFVKVIRAYNLDIAEYVMAVADLSVPDDRFVSMLIATPIQWQAAATALPGQPVAPLLGPGQLSPNGKAADGILP